MAAATAADTMTEHDPATPGATMNAVFEPAPYKLTVDAYHALAEAGHLREDARVELIEGVIVEMAPIGWPHGRIGGLVNKRLVQAVGERGLVVPNDSLPMRPWNEPQPDLVVYPPDACNDDSERPEAPEVLLVVEISESSLSFDRGRKARVYANGGVREYWVVDVAGERVEVRRAPSDGAWTQTRIAQRGDLLDIEALPGISLAVDALFR
jgi:Uma2 family endonuclease